MLLTRLAAGTTAQRRARDILRSAMEAEGFTVYSEEWWHYDFKGWRDYPIMNVAPDADAPQKARAQFPGEAK